jgi:hypothetical protein
MSGLQFFFSKVIEISYARSVTLTKGPLLALVFLTVLWAGCSTTTDYYTYSGSGIYEGKGGASKNVDGVDIWLDGTPARKFKIIGYITDKSAQWTNFTGLARLCSCCRSEKERWGRDFT